MMEIYNLTVHEIKKLLDNKEITVSEITDSFLKRIAEKEKDIQAFITICDEQAKERAKQIEEELVKEENSSPYAGIPIGIKDNISTKGIRTTCASKMLENYIPPYDATVIEKIKAEKLNIIGKLNMDEFAMGTTTESSYFKKTKNPHNINKVPGGSSGGSAAAVAAGMVPWALGSETACSIRQPASYCGIVGLNPTYGMVSRYGLVAYASSLDQIGTLTKDVRDAGILLNIISGYDKKDSTSQDITEKDYTRCLTGDIRGVKIALPKGFLGEGINEEVKQSILNAAKKYENMGAIVEEVSLDIGKKALATYYIIVCAEASSNLGRFDGIRYGYRSKSYANLKELYRNSRGEGFGDEVKCRIILGTYVLSSGYYDAYYKKAQQVRTMIKKEFSDIFKKYDVILTPTAPTVAPDIDGMSDNPIENFLADICTAPSKLVGLPAISIPCGKNSEGLPIGLQLIGNHFEEEKILNTAYAFEQNGGGE